MLFNAFCISEKANLYNILIILETEYIWCSLC